MLSLWGTVLSAGNLLAGMVTNLMIFDSFFYRRYRGARFWGMILLWTGLEGLQIIPPFCHAPQSLRVMATCVINTLVLLGAYRTRWDRAFFVAVVTQAIFSIPFYWGDWLVMTWLNLTHDQLIWNIPLYSVVFVCKTVVCVGEGLLFRLLHHPLPPGDAPPRVWGPLVSLLPLCTMGVFYASYARLDESGVLQGALAVLDGMNIVALLLFDWLERSAMDREALVAATERARVQDENLQALSQAYGAQRKMTHDFRACLTTLSGLLDQGDLPAARAYLEELKVRQTERVLLVNTHNAAIDAVLNQKGYAGQQRGLDLRFAVSDLSAVRLPAVEVTLVLGNLLDNAMEACESLPAADRWVEVRVIYHQGGQPPVLSVSVVNPSRPVTVVDGWIATRKADALQHGYGLRNVCEILDRYGAEYTFFYEDGRFVFSADWPDPPR